MFTGKTIFFAALDWGMGHVTRSAVLLDQVARENEVIVGVTASSKNFYDENFPSLKKVELPSYNIQYSNRWPAWLSVLFQWSGIRKTIRNERKLLERLMAMNKVDLVISDNRFGLYNKNIQSVIITHQLTVAAPFLKFLPVWYNKKLLMNFDEVYVPDFESMQKKLAGNLSFVKHFEKPVSYIGPQSWLAQYKSIEPVFSDVLILLSGPEPQRTIFENELLDVYRHSKQKIILVRGSDNPKKSFRGNISGYDIVTGKKLCALIKGAARIVCRSGYSTLMDLYLLEKKDIVLVPTPGQTEQEYLAGYWQKKFGVKVVKQRELKSGLSPD